MNAPLSPLDIFRAKGIPNRRVEAWKYSDLRGALDGTVVDSVSGAAFVVVSPPAVETQGPADALPAWAAGKIGSVSNDSSMDAAARAFSRRAAFFRIPAGAHVEQPLEIAFTSGGHAHVVVFVEDNASVTLVESIPADQSGLLNVSLMLYLGKRAKLTHIRRAPFASGLVAVETVSAVQQKGSRYRAHLLHGGGKLTRTEVHVTLEGEGAECEMSGASVLNHGAHADITTHIDHAVGNTASRQLFKKVVGEHSRGVYQGKITVQPGANGSDSSQTAKALLLDARVEADLKPELEILADDVKCAHGAAIGDLDLDSLFYLRSRGIPEAEARSLLIRAFLEEAVDTIEDETLRAQAWRFVEGSLAEATKAGS